MPYSTRADVRLKCGGEKRYVQICDQDGDGLVLGEDLTVIDNAIAEADGQINSRVAKSFAVPLTPATDEIRWLSARWAVHLMLREGPIGLSAADLESHAEDLKWLEDLRDGNVTLGVTLQPAKAPDMRVDEVVDRPVESLACARARMGGMA